MPASLREQGRGAGRAFYMCTLHAHTRALLRNSRRTTTTPPNLHKHGHGEDFFGSSSIPSHPTTHHRLCIHTPHQSINRMDGAEHQVLQGLPVGPRAEPEAVPLHLPRRPGRVRACVCVFVCRAALGPGCPGSSIGCARLAGWLTDSCTSHPPAHPSTAAARWCWTRSSRSRTSRTPRSPFGGPFYVPLHPTPLLYSLCVFALHRMPERPCLGPLRHEWKQ